MNQANRHYEPLKPWGMDRDDHLNGWISGYVRGAPPAYHDFLTGAALMTVMTIGSTLTPSIQDPGFQFSTKDSSIFSIGNPYSYWVGGRPNVCQLMKRRFVPVLKGILYVPGVAGSLLFGNVWWPANSHKPGSAHFFTPASLEWKKTIWVRYC